MNPKDRQKMCLNCDGRISFDADVCPYCSASQSGSSVEKGSSKELHHQSLQDSLTALYTPPYSNKNGGFKTPANVKNEDVNARQFQPLKESIVEKKFVRPAAALGAPAIPSESREDQSSDEEGRSTFWPIMLLSVGANLLMLGLLQLLFSDNGYLRLEWNSSYWFVYCLISAPLFYLGFKKINTLHS